ncbi:MAG: DUF1028 domain-containing protein [Marinirhabdus sp.]
MKKTVILLLALACYCTGFSQDTFSIIAVDPATGEIGSAGASCLDGSGNFGGIIDIITTIIPGRGGVNSQAYVCIPNVNLANAITQMQGGASPSEIIDYLMNNDACSSQNFNPQFRQYGIADFDTAGNPRTAGFTGSLTDDYKEDRQGATYSVQGNILLNQTVLDNMENNFNTTSGTLADKLMAAMQGANFAGADSRCLARGTSSTTAYMLVYRENDAMSDPYLRLNIEEMPFGEEPIDSLQVLYDNFLGVEQFDLKEAVRVFPNPARDFITVNHQNGVVLKKLSIYDVNGSVVLSKQNFDGTANSETMHIATLGKGIYFLTVESVRGSVTFKFVKD